MNTTNIATSIEIIKINLEDLVVGFQFLHKNDWWEIGANYEGYYFGTVNLRTNEFLPMELDRLVRILDKENCIQLK